jgi:hypothetical protein
MRPALDVPHAHPLFSLRPIALGFVYVRKIVNFVCNPIVDLNLQALCLIHSKVYLTVVLHVLSLN